MGEVKAQRDQCMFNATINNNEGTGDEVILMCPGVIGLSLITHTS